MSSIKAPLKIRINNSFKGIVSTFKTPYYVLMALIFCFLITGLIIWSLNLDLLKFTLFEAPISFEDRLRIIWDVQTGIYTAYSSIQATGMILFGIFFGINFALIIKAVKSGAFKRIPKKSGGAGLFFAILSGGCVACGTSILTPIIATLGATASISVAELSNVLNWISIILISYSIYKLGGVINNTQSLNNV